MDNPELADTDPSELDPQTRAAREFAGLVSNMLEPITSRLEEGDQQFKELKSQLADLARAVHRLADAVTEYRTAVDRLAERLTRLEGQHASRHPRDSMRTAPGG